MIKPLCMALVLAGLTGLAVAPVRAADEANSGKIRQVQQEKRKLEQEKNQLTAEKSALDTQLKESQSTLESEQKKADGLSSKSRKLEKELTQSRDEKTALETRVSDLQKQLAEAQTRLAEAAALRGKLESDRSQLETNVSERDRALSSCIGKNQQAYETGLELLDKYQKKSCFSSLLQHEPFTGIRETRIENEVAAGRDQLDKEHIVPAPAAH